MTSQDAFNKVWETFVVDQAPQSLTGSSCVYGPPETIGCAIACLLPYRLRGWVHKWENSNREGSLQGVSNLIKENTDVAEHFSGVTPYFLIELQCAHDTPVHDGIPFHEVMHLRLTEIATNNSLTIPKETK
jgi:hypothetical protein